MRRNAIAALAHRALGAAERRIARIGINVLPGTVVRRPEHVGVLVEAERTDLVHDAADARVVLHDRVGIFALRERLVLELGCRHVRLMHLHEVDAHEERLRRLARCGRDTRATPSRRTHQRTECRPRPLPLMTGVFDVLTVDLEILFRRLSRVARHCALGHALEHGAQLGIHIRKPGRIGVSIGIEVIKARVLHLVVALRVGQRIVGFAKMPLAREERLVAAGLEHRSERPFRCRQAAALALEGHGRHAAAIGNAARLHRRATGRATRLRVERHELHAFGRKAVEIGRRHAAVLAAAVHTRIAVTEVIRHDEDDVGLLVLSLRLCRLQSDPQR